MPFSPFDIPSKKDRKKKARLKAVIKSISPEYSLLQEYTGVFLCLYVLLTYSLVIWGLVLLFPRAFASVFTPDPALLDFTSRVLPIYFFGVGLFGIQIACQMTFVSLGNAPSSVIVAVVRKFVLLIPLIYVVPHFVSDATVGVYLAEPIADILAVTFTSVLFFFRFRKSLRAIETNAP